MTRSNVLRLAILGLIWGSSYPLIKVAGEGLTPGQLVLARLLLGAVVLVGIGAVAKLRPPRFGIVWVHLAVAAILGMVAPFYLLAWGEQHTSAAMAGVLTGASPLLTLALAMQLRTEKAAARNVIGVVLGFVGVVIVIGPWHGAGGTLGGDVACLVVAAIYAAQAVYMRRFLSGRGIAPMTSAAAQTLIAACIQAVFLPFLAWRTPSFTWSVSASIVVLGVLGTGVAYVLYYRLIDEIGPTSASSVNYLVPFISLVISAVLLSEAIAWNVPVGGVVIVVSILVAENQVGLLRLVRRRPRPAAEPATTPSLR